MSGLGCSLNVASRSFLERQRFICFSKYAFMPEGTLNVPSFAITREAGSKSAWPEGPGSSVSSGEVTFRCFGGLSKGDPLGD